jgi:hypothetical protein
LNEDFLDMLRALLDEEVDFMVVGAYALAIHDVPRATGDIDIWLGPGADNARRVRRALQAFGAPLDALDISERDLATPGMVVQVGVAPRRIDLLTALDGVDFERARSTRVLHQVDALEVPFIGRDDLIRNKRATGVSRIWLTSRCSSKVSETGPSAGRRRLRSVRGWTARIA